MPEPIGSPPPDPVSLPRHRPLGSPLVAAALVLFILSSVTVAFLYGRGPAEATVPDLVGLTAGEARARAEDAGISLMAERTEASAGIVARQDPAPGRSVSRGAPVQVHFEVPAPLREVPRLEGLEHGEARALLRQAGLAAGRVRQVSEPAAAPGTVLRQRPGAGDKVPEGGAVDLWVAAEGAAVTVPQLFGLQESGARALAAAAGIELEVLGEVSDEGPPGTVVRQSPPAGAAILPGDRVVVVVNQAPAAGQDAHPVPGLYSTLARVSPVPVLYPAVPLGGLTLDESPSNPLQRNGPAGDSGFEIVYVDPARPGVRLSFLLGSWFDPAVEEATTVDVGGRLATLGRRGSALLLAWDEHSARYGVLAEGLEESEVISFAAALRPVPSNGTVE